jgi:hypothetical protein
MGMAILPILTTLARVVFPSDFVQSFSHAGLILSKVPSASSRLGRERAVIVKKEATPRRETSHIIILFTCLFVSQTISLVP